MFCNGGDCGLVLIAMIFLVSLSLNLFLSSYMPLGPSSERNILDLL